LGPENKKTRKQENMVRLGDKKKRKKEKTGPPGPRARDPTPSEQPTQKNLVRQFGTLDFRKICK